MKRLFLILVLIAGPAGAAAQNAQQLTPEQAVDIGLQNSRALRLARTETAEASARLTEVRANRYPAITGQAGYQRLSSNIPDFRAGLPANPTTGQPAVELFTIPALLNRYQAQVSVQQPIYTGARIGSSIDIARHQAEAAEYDAQTAELDLIVQVQEAYWNLFRARTTREVLTGAVRQMEIHLQDAVNLRASGLATDLDVLTLETRLSEVRLQQVDAENAVELATLNLDYALGLPLGTSIEPVVDPTPSAPEPDVNALTLRALEQRPELAAVRSRIGALRSTVRLTGAERLPQVSLMAGYLLANPNQYFFPPKDAFNGNWSIGAGVSMDLWNWGKTRARTQQARARLDRGTEQEKQLVEAVALDVNRRVLELNRSWRALEVLDQARRLALTSYETAQERNRQGVAATSDVLDAEVAWRNAVLKHTAALADYRIARAALDRATGPAR